MEPYTDLADHARLLAAVAVEAAEEPDTIIRRPEVIDALEDLAARSDLAEIFERVAPGSARDPQAYVRALADAARPYREALLQDAPELVANIAVVAWVVQQAAEGRVADEGPVYAVA